MVKLLFTIILTRGVVKVLYTSISTRNPNSIYMAAKLSYYRPLLGGFSSSFAYATITCHFDLIALLPRH
jgi:hypothetical protein